MSEQPSYLLYFRPLGRAVIRDFFNAHGEVRELLTRPPETRNASFGMYIPAVPHLRDAEFWELNGNELLSGRVRRLRIYLDGTVIFRASADDSFLCWPRERQDRVVNPVVVVDSIASFCRFVRALLLMMSVRPESVNLGVEIRNAAYSEPPLKVYAGGLRNEMGIFTLGLNDLHTVGERDPRREVTVPVSDLLASTDTNPSIGADTVAYLVVEQFYGIFGLDYTSIPYVDRAGAQPLVDIQGFAK